MTFATFLSNFPGKSLFQGMAVSLTQRSEWIFLRENTKILFKDPQWHFAQMIAANNTNQDIQLERAFTHVNKPFRAREEVLAVFDVEHPSYRFATKFQFPAYRMIKGNILQMHFDDSPTPTNFCLIHDRVVAFIEHHDAFKRRIFRDISDWQTAMHKKLLIIFTTSLAFGLIVTSFVLLKVFCVALIVLAAVRLCQFYSFRKTHQGIFHVGQWVVELWKSGRIDPSLVTRYPDAYNIFIKLEAQGLEAKTVNREALAAKRALIYRPIVLRPLPIRTQPV